MLIDSTLTDEIGQTKENAATLEAAGYDGLWAGEIRHEPFLQLLQAAEVTERVTVGSSIAIAFARTPMTMASQAYDMAQYSGGRFVLGIGSQVKPHIERGSFLDPCSRARLHYRNRVEFPDANAPVGFSRGMPQRRHDPPMTHLSVEENLMAEQIPLVDYLVLGADPHLVAQECVSCGARFFDRRNACANCEDTEFRPARVATTGEVKAFTIVAFAAPGVPVPFVAALLDCDGTSVRANIINTPADPEHVTLGMKVRLATEVIGTDDNGTEAVGFGFEPLGG